MFLLIFDSLCVLIRSAECARQHGHREAHHQAHHRPAQEEPEPIPTRRAVQRDHAQTHEVSRVQDDPQPAQQEAAQHLLPILRLQKVSIIIT